MPLYTGKPRFRVIRTGDDFLLGKVNADLRGQSEHTHNEYSNVTTIARTDENTLCECTTRINLSRKSMHKDAGSIPASPRATFSIQEKRL